LETADEELAGKITVNQDKAEAVKKVIENTSEDDVVEAIESNEVLVSTILAGADENMILEAILANSDLEQFIIDSLEEEDEEFMTAKGDSDESEESEDSEEEEQEEEEKEKVND